MGEFSIPPRVPTPTPFYPSTPLPSSAITNEILKTSTNNSHIVFIMVDDMGHNDMGYSSSDMTHATETLNFMAEHGVKLQRYELSS